MKKMLFSIPTKNLINEDCGVCSSRFKCLTSRSIRVLSDYISIKSGAINVEFDLPCRNMKQYNYGTLTFVDFNRLQTLYEYKWHVDGSKLFMQLRVK